MIASVNAARAQDLQSGVNSAAGELRGVIKVGLGVAAVLIVAIGLVVAALKFSRKEQDAVWYLVGTAVGSVLCGVGAAMLERRVETWRTAPHQFIEVCTARRSSAGSQRTTRSVSWRLARYWASASCP